VAFIQQISHAPNLHDALAELMSHGMRGPVTRPIDKKIHMLGPTAYGWEALERGGTASKRDVAKRMPPLAGNLWMGHQAERLLDPVASRSTHTSASPMLVAALAGLAAFGIVLWLQNQRSD
jgi:hypothetical protein